MTRYELDNIDKRADLDIFAIYTAEMFVCDIFHKRKRRGLKKKQQEAFRKAMRHIGPGETITMQVRFNRLPDGRPDLDDLGLEFYADIVSIDAIRQYEEYDDDDDY